MSENQDKPSAPPSEPEGKTNPTPEGVMNLPAPFVDAYWVQTWPTRMRITFGEVFIGSVQYRTAVSMTLADAEAFILFLADMIQKEKERQKEQE